MQDGNGHHVEKRCLDGRMFRIVGCPLASHDTGKQFPASAALGEMPDVALALPSRKAVTNKGGNVFESHVPR